MTGNREPVPRRAPEGTQRFRRLVDGFDVEAPVAKPSATVSARGIQRLVDRFDRFDLWVDKQIEPLRGDPKAEAVARWASILGDRGAIWFLIGLVKALREGRSRANAARAVILTGVTTPAVNISVKLLVHRARPAREPRSTQEPLSPRVSGLPGLPEPPRDPVARKLDVRTPRTPSFPSGHALAAWCAATLLAQDDALAPLWYLVAALVSWSRVHLRHHHASDVLAGAAMGVVLGRSIQRLVPSPERLSDLAR
jgi:undecaprenyl-diphosphatase